MPASFVLLLLAACALCDSAGASGVRHYVFFGMDRERIREASFLNARAFEGAQLKYTWRELEPEPDAYDFSALRSDLAFLAAHGKRLFLQLQDATFSPTAMAVPKYLKSDPRYHGGADPQYSIPGDDDRRAVIAGWVARRWDPAVQKRFWKLFAGLGREFDGKIEGINLAETAVEFGTTGKLFPKGFTPERYRDATLENMAALKRVFLKSTTLLYANFMPVEWLPQNDRGYLRSVYRRAAELHLGVGGPDLLPFKPGQMHHSYPLIRAFRGAPKGIAVQDGNYELVNPKTGKRITIAGLIDFARSYLQVDYVFWCTQEPYYSKELIPFLSGAR